jgi:DNA-binding NtrC family response regulator
MAQAAAADFVEAVNEPVPKREPNPARLTPTWRPLTMRANHHPGLLVIDDDPEVRRSLAVALQTSGFSVWLAAGEKEALAVYRAHRGAISLVLVGVSLLPAGAPAILRALKELDPTVRCCFMGGGLDPHTAESLLALGCERLFPKPVYWPELARSLLELQDATQDQAECRKKPARRERRRHPGAC